MVFKPLCLLLDEPLSALDAVKAGVVAPFMPVNADKLPPQLRHKQGE